MPRPFLLVLATAILTPILLGTGWSGEERLPLLGRDAAMTATPVALDPADPARRRVGRLRYLGGVALASPDRAFGGFSALAVQGERFTLLSDSGNLVRFRMDADWRPRDVRFGALPAGPASGWEKRDRDSESLAVDPATGHYWVGFERANATWRYGPDGIAHVVPRAMRLWRSNGGAESLARLADGRFVAIAEWPPYDGDVPMGIVWRGDPTRTPPAYRFTYRAARGYRPVDLAELPDGRLVVLERALRLPLRWSSRVALVDRGALRSGAVARGRTQAILAAPLVHDNFEGVVAVREGDGTVLWLVSDDNRLPVQRTLLLKFRLEA